MHEEEEAGNTSYTDVFKLQLLNLGSISGAMERFEAG